MLTLGEVACKFCMLHTCLQTSFFKKHSKGLHVAWKHLTKHVCNMHVFTKSSAFLLNNMKTLKKFSKNDLIFWMLQGTFLNLETTGFYGLACMSLTLGHPVESAMQFHSIRESHTVSEE